NRPGGDGYRNDRGCGALSQLWRLSPTGWRDNQAANPGHRRVYRSAAPTHARGFSSPCGRGDAESLALQKLNADAATIRPLAFQERWVGRHRGASAGWTDGIVQAA